MRVYPYLRASTTDQNAERAKQLLIDFASQYDLTVATFFVEHDSGAKLERVELFRLLDVAQEGDILLVEQIDRLSRLTTDDWEKLKNIIARKKIRVVSIDLPTSYMFMKFNDEFTERIFATLNSMMLDVLAAVARKDYLDRRTRQTQGITKAKTEGKYKGRPVDTDKHENIRMLLPHKSWSEIERICKCSRATIAKVAKQMRKEQQI